MGRHVIMKCLAPAGIKKLGLCEAWASQHHELDEQGLWSLKIPLTAGQHYKFYWLGTLIQTHLEIQIFLKSSEIKTCHKTSTY